ncbi:MAG TPA: hypothetical protein VE130_03735 [Nitrososphaeraceae archaeon]|nr:hypothetical protein [Nitrososphaeraceae archaeon]
MDKRGYNDNLTSPVHAAVKIFLKFKEWNFSSAKRFNYSLHICRNNKPNDEVVMFSGATTMKG